MCEAAMLPTGSIEGNETLTAIEGWDSLAGVDFQRIVAERWDIEMDGMRVSEARSVVDMVNLLGGAVTA